MTDRMRVLLVGFGPVGARFVEELLPAVRDGLVELTVVGAEHDDAYNRVLIAEYAVGRTDRDAMAITDPAAAIEAGVRLVTGASVTGIDRSARLATLSTGAVEAYDRLVLATGARANVPTLEGVDRVARDLPSLSRTDPSSIASDQRLPLGVSALRDVADAEVVRASVVAGDRIVVLGAGLLGLEFALAASKQGAEVCVVHHGGYPMARNLDRGGGTVLARDLKRAGVSLVARTRAEGIIYRTADDGTRRFDALMCADGKDIHGDLLLLSCGVSARIELATLAGLPTSSGILVDAGLRSWGDENIYAMGDCAQVASPAEAEAEAGLVRGAPSGLIGPGWRQAEWLASRFAADVRGSTSSVELPEERAALVMLKADDIDVVSAGAVDLDPWEEDLPAWDDPAPSTVQRQVSQWVDPEHGRYLKMVTRAGVLEGFVSVGLPRTGAELTLLFERGSELPADRSVLLRNDGPDFVPSMAAGAFASDTTICWCNGVTVGHIHEAAAAGNTTVQCIGKATRAGTGCGGCKGRIADVLERYSESGDAAEVVA